MSVIELYLSSHQAGLLLQAVANNLRLLEEQLQSAESNGNSATAEILRKSIADLIQVRDIMVSSF